MNAYEYKEKSIQCLREGDEVMARFYAKRAEDEQKRADQIASEVLVSDEIQ